MNLSSLGPFSSLATNALDTARSTFKGLADAATDTGAPTSPTANKAAETRSADSKTTEQKAAERKAAEAKRAEAKRAEAKLASKTEATADSTEPKFKGRLGNVLDAYA
jgi:hypothetical protein